MQYFNYKSPADGHIHQVWYDNPRSLAAKTRMAWAAGVRGVGSFTVDFAGGLADPTRSPGSQACASGMWSALTGDPPPPGAEACNM